EAEHWKLQSHQFPSKVGGKPAWLSQLDIPSSLTNSSRVNVYAPIPGQDRSFHRTFFVFCYSENDSRCLKESELVTEPEEHQKESSETVGDAQNSMECTSLVDDLAETELEDMAMHETEDGKVFQKFKQRIMSEPHQLLNDWKVDSPHASIDWGILAVYTCADNCDQVNKYSSEFIWKQDFKGEQKLL
ncbi:unnamed protein product, partial [Coregonus sp. 'balchen']